MRTHYVVPTAMLLACVIAGCTPAVHHPAQSYDPDVITISEMRNINGGSALDAIRRVRPNFLSMRGRLSLLGPGLPMPTVYLDGMRYGGIETLRQIPSDWISEIRVFRPSNIAHAGADNAGGVVSITTRKQ